ncbi:MAG: short-chain dehydrogenase [Rhodospirillaceae bacterium]|nr:short-chain dehydrogenase [Rhodospirillaceae bacterium]
MGALDNKVAIVTGAGGGIGRAISMRFAAEGAAVICVDIDDKRVNTTVDEIVSGGGQGIALIADVAVEANAEAAVAAAIEGFGGLHVLVSNAIYDLPLARLTEISYDDWRRTMDVNLNSAFLFSKHAIPVIEANGGGSIILIASQLGRTAKPGRPWYCAQKGALINMAKAMALDHAHQNIRVNSLSPGPVETDRFITNFEDRKAARAANNTMLDRLGKPEEIAAGAVFLASEESSFMTGSDLLIDGGYTAI